MEYAMGIKLDQIEEKLDMVLMKLYPEEFKKQNEMEKKKIEEEQSSKRRS